LCADTSTVEEVKKKFHAAYQKIGVELPSFAITAYLPNYK
jgi:hypothetical protein